MPAILSAGMGLAALVASSSAWSPTALGGSTLLRWAHARTLSQFYAGSTAGSGTVASGGTAGYWADLSPNAGPLVQATSSQRPVLRKHASKGRGCIVMGSGDLGAGGDCLVTAAAVTGIKYAYLVATPIGPDTTRGSGVDPVGRFNDDYHGFLGTAPLSASAVLYTGFAGQNTWGPYSLTGYTRDGTTISAAAADVGYGRRRYVYRVTHGSAADSGALNVLRHVGYDGYYARGGVHELLVLSSSATAGELTQIDTYLQGYWLAGPQVIFAGDSLTAGYGLTESQGPAALLWEAYEGSVDCPCIAIPGQGVTSSINPLSQTMAADDPAKVLAIKGGHSNVVVALAGTNDLFNGRTAVQLLADVQAYAAAVQAAGHRVVVGTVAPRSDGGWTGGMETQRVAYNTALRASHAFADGFVDVDVIAPGLQGDGVHWTAAGTVAVVTGTGGVKTAVDALI